MSTVNQNGIAVTVISDKIAQLEPDVASQIAEARQSLAELVRLLGEQKTLQGAIESLQGTRQELDDDDRWSFRSRDPLLRARRALREIEMLERDRDPERPRLDLPSLGVKRRTTDGPSIAGSAQPLDIVAAAKEFAASHDNLVRLPELAAYIVERDPGRYRSVVSAQASLYYHLGKSEQFEKAGTGAFRLVERGELALSAKRQEGGAIED